MLDTSALETLKLANLAYGLGVFLFGMRFLERGLKSVSRTRVRYWLGRYTSHPLGAVLSGTCITAFLQSSSLVILIMMAMVGASIIPLSNAIGVVLGANLGTTFTGWVVATLGFKMKMSAHIVPLMGIGALTYVFCNKQPKLQAVGEIVLGLAFLLFGLSLMKGAIANLPEFIDFSAYRGFPPWAYLLLGAVLTALIQSSSASMMIALALLDSELFTLPAAMAFIIGADLGTTSTSIIGAWKGTHLGKQLALAHVSFNFMVDFLAFIFLLPIFSGDKVTSLLSDPIYTLVVFHSTFNFIGILLFMPFIKRYSKWIEKVLPPPKVKTTRYIHSVPLEEVSLAIVALVQEVKALALDTCRYCRTATIKPVKNDWYSRLKTWEGEIIEYAIQLPQPELPDIEVHKLLSIARHCIYACKAINDSKQDWAHSSDEHLTALLEDWRRKHTRLIAAVRLYGRKEAFDEDLEDDWMELLVESKEYFKAENTRLHQIAKDGLGDDQLTLSSVLNLNRELFTCHDHLIKAFKHQSHIDLSILSKVR